MPHAALSVLPDTLVERADPRAAMRAQGYDSDSVYFEFQVDQRAQPFPGGAQPQYPASLRAESIQGDVLTQFVIDSTGRVVPGSLRVLRSSHELFTAAVRATIGGTTFTPARLRGRPVPQLARQPYEFRLGRGNGGV